MKAKSVHIRRNTNIHGELVERTPEEYPYSYDHFAVWKGTNFSETTDTVYSDRMRNWSPDKFAACCIRVWDSTGQSFAGRKPEDIEQFLRLYYDVDLDLTGIEEGCNAGNGYPYWVFYFKANEPFKENHLELTDEDRHALNRQDEISRRGAAIFDLMK